MRSVVPQVSTRLATYLVSSFHLFDCFFFVVVVVWYCSHKITCTHWICDDCPHSLSPLPIFKLDPPEMWPFAGPWAWLSAGSEA